MRKQSDKPVSLIMTREIVTMSSGTSLIDASKRIENARISSLLVEENGMPVGILTEHDIMRALWQGVATDTLVESVMTRGLICVNENDTIHSAYHKMALHSIRHLVVVNENKNPVGVISETDFRKQRGIESFVGAIDVGGTMSQSFVHATGDLTVREAARQMQLQKASCTVVVEHHRPVGVVTERDMVRLFSNQSAISSLSEVMTSSVTTVLPEVLLVDAVRLMQQLRIRRLVVVDKDGILIGILNEHDILKHIEDEYVQMLQLLVSQQAQELNEDKFRAVVNNLPDKIIVKDDSFTYVSCNLSYAADLGFAPDQIIGKNDFDFFPKELADRYRADDRKVLLEGEILIIEEPYIQNEKRRWIRSTKAPMRTDSGEISGVVSIFHDITLQRNDIEELRQRTWALEAIAFCNNAVSEAENEDQIWSDACVALTSDDKFGLVWVGWAEHTLDKNVKLLASAGKAQEALKDFRASWGDDEFGKGPTGRAIRLNQTQAGSDITNQLDTSAHRFSVRDFGIESYLAVPIRIDHRAVGVMMVCAYDIEAFTTVTIKLFEDLVNNITLGVESLIHRQAHLNVVEAQRQQSVKLERSLEDALTAIAATLEQRDPYTAGHQKQVANLAVMIGKELALNDYSLRGLYLAGIVHDLGKIQIPSEILTKPSRLSSEEFNLVKLHPEVGYNILKPIDFPWPIAVIVRQHHEYLNGSGYPLGLTAEKIILESKILTVADIVESMSADRPYRPALGIDSAIQEIEKLSGVKLDESVVKACVSVLRRGEFVPVQIALQL
jgi:PAS domain S-box-containing protein